MKCTEAMQYVSAFVDRDYTGLPETVRIDVEANLRLCPHCAAEWALERATKQLLERHAHDIRCPRTTLEQIQTILYHVYRSSATSFLP